MQTKKVNIYPKNPITSVNPPIRTAIRNVTKPISDIRRCIIEKAYVEEVLPDGETIVLDFTNYNKNNFHIKEEKNESVNKYAETFKSNVSKQPIKEDVKQETKQTEKNEEDETKDTNVNLKQTETKPEQVQSQQQRQKKNNKKQYQKQQPKHQQQVDVEVQSNEE